MLICKSTLCMWQECRLNTLKMLKATLQNDNAVWGENMPHYQWQTVCQKQHVLRLSLNYNRKAADESATTIYSSDNMPPTLAWARRLFTACCRGKCMNPLIWVCWTEWGCKNRLVQIPSINYLYIKSRSVLFWNYSNYKWTKMKIHICCNVLYKNYHQEISHLCGESTGREILKAAQITKTHYNHMSLCVFPSNFSIFLLSL